MKISLTQKFVLQDLRFDKRPFLRPDGSVGWKDNADEKAYVVTDAHQNAPVGFAVKVGKLKKTYIIQRRVRSAAEVLDGPENLKLKVGNVSDFNSLDEARNAARALAEVMVTHKRGPKDLQRESAQLARTVGEILADYLTHLKDRTQKPIVANTEKNLMQAIGRLQAWRALPIKNLKSEMIVARFDEIFIKTPTAAEQTFAWAKRAVDYAIKRDERLSTENGRPRTLTYNPFSVLREEGKYRDRASIETAIEVRGVRRPLDRESLGKWFDALANRRDRYRTAIDYLLLTTLWGRRREESAQLRWRDTLTVAEAFTTSHVDLDKKAVFFAKTKNGSNLELPLADAAYGILKQRFAIREALPFALQRKWVFPAESKFSKTGRYSDMRQVMEGTCNAVGITPIRPHDMRRTFGRFASTLVSAVVEKKLMNHKDLIDSTPKYNEQEWAVIKEAMQKIELNMLAYSPRLYNMLLVPGRPPLAQRSDSVMSQNDGLSTMESTT